MGLLRDMQISSITFEARRAHELEAKHGLRRYGRPSTINFHCQICHRMCRLRGLLAHKSQS